MLEVLLRELELDQRELVLEPRISYKKWNLNEVESLI